MKIGIYMGRFQPFHNGHASIINSMIEDLNNGVIDWIYVFIGSCNVPRTMKNPFSYNEKYKIIKQYFENRNIKNQYIFLTNDFILDSDWVISLEMVTQDNDVTVYGCTKNEWYKDLFPKKWQWVNSVKNVFSDLHATTIREMYFSMDYKSADRFISCVVPEETMMFLKDFRTTSWYGYISCEYGTKEDLNLKYGTGPFLTVDNIVFCKNEVLLINRKNHPGKGLWAVPGGYFDKDDDTLMYGAFRELQEETTFKLTFSEYKNKVYKNKIFDKKDRSQVARLITSAFYLKVDEKFEVKGADDAKIAEWKSLDWVTQNQNLMFDDHYEMIMKGI